MALRIDRKRRIGTVGARRPAVAPCAFLPALLPAKTPLRMIEFDLSSVCDTFKKRAEDRGNVPRIERGRIGANAIILKVILKDEVTLGMVVS